VDRNVTLSERVVGVNGRPTPDCRVRNDVNVQSSDFPDPARPVTGGTVTVLFADVEGSTALLERLGQARWLEGLAEYEALLNASLARHGGTLVKALGDGHLLAFPSARAALRCAIDVQRALPLDAAPDLRVRMGIHTGEPAVREDDLHGRTVVKAARIADLARGGEILVSSVVRELAEADEDLGEELWFEDGREVELRGLRGRHLVMSARWDPLARTALRVVIADDSALVRDGVAAVLRESGVHVAALAGDADSLYREVERHRPDVALVDIRMPPTGTNEGLVAAEHIGRHYPEVAVLVLSQYVEFSYAMRLVEGGEARRGYLLKDRVSEIETLLDAIRRVAHGGTVVDPAIVEQFVSRPAAGGPLAALGVPEREVLGLVAEGFSDAAIAERLGLTPTEVETHVEQIFLKLGLRDEDASDRRVAAVLAYLRATLVR
jgi:DNA-binding NarL/FixJ family response regulator/class 3 adenylate cyclase